MTEQHLTPARARLIALLEDKRFSLAEASRRIGRNAAYLFQYVHRNTPRKLDEDTRQALAEILGVHETVLREGAPTQLSDVAQDYAASNRLPLVGSTASTDQSHILMNDGEPRGYVDRPPYLAGADDAFAVEMVGDSMEPRYRAGELLHIHPARAIARGDDVLVELTGGIAMIREFVRIEDDTMVFHQHNPGRDRAVEKAEITRMYRIVGIQLR